MNSLPDIPWVQDEPNLPVEAVALAKRGMHVFPLKPRGKQPLTRNGVKDATLDPDQIGRWWDRWPDANIGIACGPSNLVVVDLDGPEGEQAWATRTAHADLTATLEATTGRGRHLYYRHDHDQEPLGNTASKLGPGIDTRGAGGYVIAPPSLHPTGARYTWVRATTRPGLLPSQARPDPTRQRRPQPTAAPNTSVGLLPYVRAALDAETTDLANTPEGARNDACNRAAYNLGQLVGAGALPDATAHDALQLAARACGLPDSEAATAIRSGLTAGEQAPRQIPEHYGQVVPMPPRTTRGAPGPAQDPGAGDTVDTQAADDPDHPSPATSWGDGGDTSRADLLLDHHADGIRHVELLGWHAWDGTRWKIDPEDAHVARRYRATIENFRDQTKRWRPTTDTDREQRKRLLRETKQALSVTARQSALDWASKTQTVRVTVDELDQHQLLLNAPNGTINLETGTLHDHQPGQLLTRSAGCPYRPEARDQRLDGFLLDLMDGNPDEVQALQRCVGYSISGLVEEEIALLPHGPSGTGKSTMVDALTAMLGDYAVTVDFNLFVKQPVGRGEGPSPELLAARGARMVFANEVDPGRTLAAGRFKAFVSGDVISARRMRSDHMIEFRPQAMLCFASNERLKAAAADDALWRRIRQIPCTHVPRVRDNSLKRHLTHNPGAQEALLAWAVQGFQMWREHGLDLPKRWLEYTAEYQREQDWLGEFLEDQCVIGGAWEAPSHDIYRAYKAWAESRGDRPVSETQFGAELTRRGHTKRKTRARNMRTGLRLRLPDEAPQPPGAATTQVDAVDGLDGQARESRNPQGPSTPSTVEGLWRVGGGSEGQPSTPQSRSSTDDPDQRGGCGGSDLPFPACDQARVRNELPINYPHPPQTGESPVQDRGSGVEGLSPDPPQTLHNPPQPDSGTADVDREDIW